MEKGDMVLIEYTGKTDGNVFDTTDEETAQENGLRTDAEYKPVPVLLGQGYVIEGLEDALLDMEVGESRTLEVEPDKAYGGRDSSRVETYPEKEFNRQGVNVSPGEEIMIGNRRGRVVSKGSGRVRVDFNHPLAGKTLEYDLEIVEKVEDDKEIAESIYSFRVGHGEISFSEDTVEIPASHSHGDHKHELPENTRKELEDEILEHTSFEDVEFVE